MTKIKLDFLGVEVTFYSEKKEYKRFLERCKEAGADVDELNSFIGHMEDSPEGLHAATFVWVKDKTDLPVIVHELLHVVDTIFLDIGVSEELEFRAYVMEYLFKKVLEYIQK